jgi:hypothetical protein
MAGPGELVRKSRKAPKTATETAESTSMRRGGIGGMRQAAVGIKKPTLRSGGSAKAGAERRDA